MKKKYYIGLGLILFESIVSGAYTPIDTTWIILRAGLIVVYAISAMVDRKESVYVISWLPLATIVLSLLSVDNKYKSLEAEKLNNTKSDYITSVKAPLAPVLPNCDNLTKWRLDECQKKVEKLQLVYSTSLEKYNSRVINSEKNIQLASVQLTFREELPVWLYVIFICVLSGISFAASPKTEEKEKPVQAPKKEINKDEIVKRFFDTKGKTIETYCFENGLAVSSFKRWKKDFETRMSRSETKVRLFEVGKRETA